MTKKISDVRVGDVIMPPAREVSLWMRRCCIEEKHLPESAMYLTVTSTQEGQPDKRGRWVLITANHTPAWLGDRPSYPFRFKARPDTQWLVMEGR